MDIVKKLDIAVCFGSDRRHVGQGRGGVMTFNDNLRWVCPIVPTDCDYAKLDGHFGKLRNAEITALQTQGGFGRHLEVREVAKCKNQRLMGNMEIANRLFRARKAQFGTISRKWRTPFRDAMCQNEAGELREIERFPRLGIDSECVAIECEHLEISKYR